MDGNIIPHESRVKLDNLIIDYIYKIVCEKKKKLRCGILTKKVRKLLMTEFNVSESDLPRLYKSWVTVFMKRTHHSYRKLNGESVDIVTSALVRGRQQMKDLITQLLKEYTLHDLFNMNETAFFSPTTPSYQTQRGRKSKVRRSLLIWQCCRGNNVVSELHLSWLR